MISREEIRMKDFRDLVELLGRDMSQLKQYMTALLNKTDNAEIKQLREAGNAAFHAMCAYRDNKDDELFQDAIDDLGLSLNIEKDYEVT